MTEEIAKDVLVKSMSVHLFYLGITKGLGNELEEKSYKELYIEYDENGKVVLERQFLPGGGTETTATYNFDERGFLIEIKRQSSEDEFTERITFEGDAAGKALKEFNHYLDDTFDTINYKYDDQGNLIEKETIDSDGEAEGKETYRYENNRLVEKKVFNEYGDLEGREVLVLDNNGNVLEKEVYNEEEELAEKIAGEYDEKNQLIRSINGMGESENEMRFKYDERGNVIEETNHDSAGEIIRKVTTVYEPSGSGEQSDLKKEQQEVTKNQGMISEQRLARKYEYEYY